MYSDMGASTYKEKPMETQKQESKKESSELSCDSRRCWKCSDDVYEERYEDVVLAAGPQHL
jgi:hypothetical protein